MTSRGITFASYASLLLFFTPGAARAVAFEWIGPGGVASYEDQTHWFPAGGPPTTGDEARFGIVGAHTVTIDPTKPVTSDQLVVEKGDYTFRSASAGTAQYDVVGAFDINTVFDTSLTIGAAGHPVNLNLANDFRVDAGATLDVLHGSGVSGEDLFFGASLGGTNTITVDGAGSSFDFTGVGAFGANGAIANLNFTNGATGSFGKDLTLINFSNADDTEANLRVNSGSSLTVGGTIGVGQSSSSTTGTQSALLSVGIGSTLTQTGTGGVAIGISSSANSQLNPRLAVSNGGVMTTGTGSTLIRHEGQLLVSGFGGSTYNANGPVVLSPTGSIFLDDGGSINASAGLDNSAEGTITHREGTIQITGGAFIPNSGGDYEVEGSSIGSGLRLALGTGSTTNITGALRFGTIQDAHLTVEGGAQLTTASAILSNANTGDTVTVTATIDGTGTLWDNTGSLDFGLAQSDLTISNQAVVMADLSSVNSGVARVESQGQWNIATALILNDDGMVEVADDGRLTTQDANLSLIGGGVAPRVLVETGGVWRSTGELVLGGSRFTPGGDGEFFVSDGGSAQFEGELVLWSPGKFQMQSGSTVDLDGPLVGRGGVFNFFGGQLNVNNTAATVLVDLTGLQIGTVDINTPTINVQRGLAVAGDTVVAGGATFTIDGGDAQLTRLVVSPGAKVDFSSGSFGTSGPLQAATGSVLDLAAGDVMLGDVAAVNGVYLGGELHAHANTVTLNDANDAVFDSGALATLAGGEIVASNGLTLDFGGNLTGHGDITTPDDATKPFINNGHIAGDSGGQPIILSGYVKGVGTLDHVVITGTDAPGLSPAAVSRGSVAYAGVLEIEIGGGTPGSEHDQLNHILGAGLAELGGSLEVQTVNGFQPTLGETFDIITAIGGVSGKFSSTTPGFEAIYNPTSVQLVATSALPGDFNNDGVVDAADYTVWRDNLGAPAGTLRNDFAGGTIGAAQYGQWVTNYGATLPATTFAVPEPSTGVVMTFFIGWILERRPTKPHQSGIDFAG